MADEPLPGRSEAAAIADWAEARRHADEFADTAAVRSVEAGAVVALRDVTADTVRAVSALQVAPGQRGSVAPNAVSIAEASYEPRAWFRMITADEVPVGFVMLSIDVETPTYYLWRFMVDARFQGLGFGRAAIALVVDHVRSLPGAHELLVSWVAGPAGPEGFYAALGFEPTGEVHGGEVEGRLRL